MDTNQSEVQLYAVVLFFCDLPDDGVSLEAVQRELLLRALEKAGGNQTQAARRAISTSVGVRSSIAWKSMACVRSRDLGNSTNGGHKDCHACGQVEPVILLSSQTIADI